MRRPILRVLLAGLTLRAVWAPAWCLAQERIDPPAKYAAAVRDLERWLQREVEAKRLPALSIALVDDQAVVWARGFGFADAEQKVPATAQTVYRVGSVSKPVTALALMLLAQLGLLDLDEPVTRYLPDFRPRGTSEKAITLRHLLAHRSGLVRESPVGNYFDDTEPSLAKTVESLNRTALVFPTEKRTSYSNAGVAVAGYVLERTRKEPFAQAMKKLLLDPVGMKSSGFELTPDLKGRLANAVMWTAHGREFPAPTFALGTAPAGNLYSTVTDLGKLLSFLFAGGRTESGPLLERGTLANMWVPRFAEDGEKGGFGVGFYVSEFEGRKRIGHGGAIYGFATELMALPDDKLGVVVVTSRDLANTVTERAAELALRHLLAVRQGKPPPKVEETKPLDPEQARRLAGNYRAGEKPLELREQDGRVWIWPRRGELRAADKGLITDGVIGYGLRLTPEGDGLRVGKDLWRRVAVPRPEPPPEKWLGLIGEYGPDHNVLYVFEVNGQLYALIEWHFHYPLTEVSRDVFAFPDVGLYPGEKLVFTRDKTGRATQVQAASVVFARRALDGEGKTFQIRPARPLDELRPAALKATPPAEKGPFRKPDLVEVTALDPTVKLDVRYATTNNFLGSPFYTSAKAYLQRPAAEALVRAHRKLQKDGYGLLIHDGYRPWHVTKMFWDATPEKYRLFVADPSKGSRHNRGCAVDLTLYDVKTGKVVEMVSGFDEFSDRSYPEYPGGTSRQRWHRDLLRRAMEAEGFTVYKAEWWHFDYRDWRAYPLLNLTFEQLAAGK